MSQSTGIEENNSEEAPGSGESSSSPSDQLVSIARSQLEHALDGFRKGHQVYESLRNLNEVIGTQYGDRVLYELIQNAHDAHPPGTHGKIVVRLSVTSENEGVLYVANQGRGFAFKNVQAIRNLATSSKTVGEGIGNKGLGFRSVEALTDDVQIYSKLTERSDHFDGYCFRFAKHEVIEQFLEEFETSQTVRARVARTVPRYLITVPIADAPADIDSFARAGYATVVVLPLKTSDAVRLAEEQVDALANLNVPLLLFLERLEEIQIAVDRPVGAPVKKVLRRREHSVAMVDGQPGCSLHRVELDEGTSFLVVRRQIDKGRVIEAVKASLGAAPELRRWLNWQGSPTISVAVSLKGEGVASGRLYNFLPMGDGASSPFAGYLDAPFFTDIDRRSAKLTLPLNNMLLTASAEACVAAAMFIVDAKLELSQTSVFDLIAWSRDQLGMIGTALSAAGSSLGEAQLVPALSHERKIVWASLATTNVWPDGRYSVLSAKEVNRRVGTSIVTPQMGQRRMQRLSVMASTIYRNLTPDGARLGPIIESFARDLASRRASPRTWKEFYGDVYKIFTAVGAELDALDGHEIFFDRNGKLRTAITAASDGARQVYVRTDSGRARVKIAVPLPPHSLARRYYFLDDRIQLSDQVLQAFVQAKLVRQFDPIEALDGLSAALGEKPSTDRRIDALVWAFQIWKTTTERADDAFRNADIHVPSWGGWISATAATFSASWTPIGNILERYLIDASEVSADCRAAKELLLAARSEWPISTEDNKRDWVRFLETIGVYDGLNPVPSKCARSGLPMYVWQPLLLSGLAAEGLDSDWCAEVSGTSFANPYTDYQIRGEVWRMPGQIEWDRISVSARESFSRLIFEHLRDHEVQYFHFEVAKFDRRDWDRKVLPTPFATFVRSKEWVAANSKDGGAFLTPSACWSGKVRRSGPPRFVNRLPEDVVSDLIDNDKLSELLFSEMVGVRDWQDTETALDRLEHLATAATVELPSSDRATLRREYQRAWSDAAIISAPLPSDLSVIVSRRGQLELITGDLQHPRELLVTTDLGRFEAKALLAAGRAVLDVGEAPISAVVNKLQTTGGFVPLRLDDGSVQLLVDGETFFPSAADPLLVHSGFEWLPEVASLGHEMLGEQLEKSILSSRVEGRVRAIRVRRCGRIALTVNSEELTALDTSFYSFDHEEMPTLIITNDQSLSWDTVLHRAADIARLIDPRLRSFEILLQRLAIWRGVNSSAPPTDEDLAFALDRDVQTVREHILALRADTTRVVQMLLPVVAYYGGADAAHAFRSDAAKLGPKFNFKLSLARAVGDANGALEKILDACERASDFAELRRMLDLEYRPFNVALVSIGEPALSNEEELRRLYDAHLKDLKPAILDRLRRSYAAAYRAGETLADYVERKSLSFLPFNDAWVFDREALTREDVAEYVSTLVEGAINDNPSVALGSLTRVVESNRKAALQALRDLSLLVVAWCRKHELAAPPIWITGDLQAIIRSLEIMGVFDFDPIEPDQIPTLCSRAGIWPSGMNEVASREALGLAIDDLNEETKRREAEHDRIELSRRTIYFGEVSLDTGAADFTARFNELASQAVGGSNDWYDRSRRRVRLATFADAERPQSGGSGGAVGGRRRQDRLLTDAQRQAIGLAGEWLAYQYLLKRHGTLTDEDSWVSSNRIHFFGGSAGNDAAGYDFEIHTPQATWMYEVKATQEDGCEFELTANELRVASGASKDGRRRYRILYIPHVLDPTAWHVLELPNPMGDQGKANFQTVGKGAVRLRFDRV